MTRRWDIGPLLVTLGSLILLVALFMNWFGRTSAWGAFELVDLLLAALAVAGVVVSAALLAPALELADRRWLPWVSGAALVVVATQLIDPPPLALGRSLGSGAWLAFAGTVVMVAGTVLTLGRVSFAVSVESRDTRRRVAAVDHRAEHTDTHDVVTPGAPESPGAVASRPRRGASLFGRGGADPEPDADPEEPASP